MRRLPDDRTVDAVADGEVVVPLLAPGVGLEPTTH